MSFSLQRSSPAFLPIISSAGICAERREPASEQEREGEEREREVEGRKKKTKEEYGLEVGGETEISN